jgi:hypothetical protein
MADNLEDRGIQDRNRINLSEERKIAYWTRKLGCTESELKETVREVGNSAETFRKHLDTQDMFK